jgi:drug/metabolite transporter (DMT)-like permease
VLIDRFFGTLLGRRELWGAGLSLVGLLLVVFSLAHGGAGRRPGEGELLLLVGTGLAAAAVFTALPARLLARGAALGIASGICYGIGDVATKGSLDGSAIVMTPIFLACHGLGFVTLQLAFQRGTILETAGLSTLFTNAIPIVIGVVVFAESPPAGPLGTLRLAGFALALVGGVLLARGEGRPEVPDVPEAEAAG